ncbi:MAG TPA: membrane dipeptidase [Longimicrobiales bacterium]|nr:membrane dipeptidase [Longimicrobiales bacterium]
MDRRDFLGRAALAGAGAGAMAWRPEAAGAAEGPRGSAGTNGAPAAPPGPQLDPNDRSPDRDPLEVQRATLVVEARDSGSDTPDQLERLRRGAVDCSIVDRGGVAGIGASLAFLDEHSGTIAQARTVREMREIHREGKIARVFHFQGPSALEREDDWRGALRGYYEAGLRISAVALNVAGRFGGGCTDPHIGLSGAGRELVEEIHRMGIVLDIAGHTGDQTSFDALEISRGVPVVCSHTNARALVDNPRNISDRLAEAIAETGGVIGITAVSDFHIRTRHDVARRTMPQVSLEKHLDQYDYFKELVGPDHIGLGIDNIEGRILLSLADHPEMYSDPREFYYIEDFESIAQLPNMTRGLIRRGWSNAELWKLLGQNWLRVYEQVWGA